MAEPTGRNPNPVAEDIEAAVASLPEAPIETGFRVPTDVVYAIGEATASARLATQSSKSRSAPAPLCKNQDFCTKSRALT
jgi:hypothetical protein